MPSQTARELLWKHWVELQLQAEGLLWLSNQLFVAAQLPPKLYAALLLRVPQLVQELHLVALP